MRPIKFRGFCEGKWYYGIPIYTHIGTYIVTEENPHVCSVYGYMEIDELVKIEDETLGQFTGLHDCDGKEIYEGDIVQEIHNPEFGYIGFHQASASFRLIKKDYDIGLGNRGCPASILQVIGNLIENSNMLKNK